MQCGTASAYPGQVMPFVSPAGIAIFFGQNLVAKFEIHFTPAKRENQTKPLGNVFNYSNSKYICTITISTQREREREKRKTENQFRI